MKTSLIKKLTNVGKLTIISSVIAMGAPYYASASAYQGHVGNIVEELGKSDLYIQITNGAFDGEPSCGQTNSIWVLVSTGSQNAPSILAMALAAKGNGNEVYVSGDAVCSAGGPNNETSEDLVVFYME